MPFSRPEEDRVSLSSESGWDQVGALFLISEERSGNRLKEFEEGKPIKRTINKSFVRAFSRTAMGAADSPVGSPRPFPWALREALISLQLPIVHQQRLKELMLEGHLALTGNSFLPPRGLVRSAGFGSDSSANRI